MSDPTFQQELETLINRHSLENDSNTPDFLLARYICMCLDAYNQTMENRRKWYARDESDPELKTLGAGSSELRSRE